MMIERQLLRYFTSDHYKKDIWVMSLSHIPNGLWSLLSCQKLPVVSSLPAAKDPFSL